MVERLLMIAIYALSSLIVVLLIWVILRELFSRLKKSESEFQSQLVRDLLKKWLNDNTIERKKTLEKLREMDSAAYLEPIFFEVFYLLSKEDRKDLKILFELLGMQEKLRKILKESPKVSEREEAVLKMGRVGTIEDLPFLLDIFRDREEHPRVKQCCIEAIYELSEPLLKDSRAGANLGLLSQLLEVPNVELREHLASILASLPVPVEDMIPHLLRLESDAAKEGVLSVMEIWERPELAPILRDYTDDLNPVVRRKAVSLLGKTKDDMSLMIFFRHLDDPDVSVRMQSIEALSHIKKNVVGQQLIKKADDPDISIQAKIFWVLMLQNYDDAFPLLIKKLAAKTFRNEFFVQLSHEKRKYLEDFFQFLGIDHRIFFRRFGWGDFDHLCDAFMATAKESQEPELRRRAMQALSLWQLLPGEREQAERLLREISKNDPDEKCREFATNLAENMAKNRIDETQKKSENVS